jgi:hypothetical protein
MASNKPETTSTGKLMIPIADFNAWCLSLLKPPAGTFVTLGKLKDKGDTLEVDYATSTIAEPVVTDVTPA